MTFNALSLVPSHPPSQSRRMVPQAIRCQWYDTERLSILVKFDSRWHSSVDKQCRWVVFEPYCVPRPTSDLVQITDVTIEHRSIILSFIVGYRVRMHVWPPKWRSFGEGL